MLSSTTNKLQVWLDCDPGLDDIMAIILTAWDERISLIGVSTSPGNSSLGNTSRNACDVLHSIGRGDVEVVMGSPKPFCSSGIYSDNIHGENGIGGLELPPAPRKPISEDRFSEIYKRIMRVTGKVCFINTGSLTNLAILLASHPDLKEKLEQVCIMGGAIGEGNMTPAAQFNIFCDPVAAQEVLNYGLKFTMVPLEVTHTALASEQILSQMGEYKSLLGRTLLQLMHIYQANFYAAEGFTHPPVHDPCAVFFLLQRERFEGRYVLIAGIAGKSHDRHISKFVWSNKLPISIRYDKGAGKLFRSQQDGRIEVLGGDARSLFKMCPQIMMPSQIRY